MSATELNRYTSQPSSETQERSTDDIRRSVEEKKEAIAETLGQIDQRVERAIDWRAHVADRPLLAVGLAVGAGCLASKIFERSPTPAERIMEAVADGVEDVTGHVKDRIEQQFNWPRTGGSLKVTAAALITRAAIAYFSNRIGSIPSKVRRTL